jgi:hypothetical protein
MSQAEEQGIFGKKDSAEIDDTDDEFAQQDTQDMPDEFNPPEVESKIFKDWIDSIADDRALFEEVVIAEDEFVDFNRALATAKERMGTLPRMGDGSPLIRKIKGMCEEVGTEYDVKAEDLYAALSGEDVINEGEPTVEGDYKGFGSGPGFGNPAHASDAKRFGYIKDAIAMAQSDEFYGNFDAAYKAIVIKYGQEVADSEEVQNALMSGPAMEDINRISHLAGIDPVIEDDEADDEEEQIDEAQSEAQKAAFQKMLDAKNGNKEETTEDADAEKDDEVEESIELDRIKHLAGV